MEHYCWQLRHECPGLDDLRNPGQDRGYRHPAYKAGQLSVAELSSQAAADTFPDPNGNYAGFIPGFL